MSVMEETIWNETVEANYAVEEAIQQATSEEQPTFTAGTEIFFVEGAASQDADALVQNQVDIWSHNQAAMRVDEESVQAFLDMLYSADPEYLDAAEYVNIQAEPQAMVDWGSVDAALGESQKILQGVQSLLSSILLEMGVEDYQYLRVYADHAGLIRLVGGHDRAEEIEAVLNSPEHHEFRSMYAAANAGMGMAGSLVGRVSVPQEVLEQYQAKVAAEV